MTNSCFHDDGKTLRAFDPALSAFALLDLVPKAALDVGAVKAAHLALSRLVHPDRFQRASPEQRECARQWSSAINEARATLSDQRKVIEFLLSTGGFACNPDKVQPPQSLLMEVFEINEALDEVEGRAPTQAEAQGLHSQRDQIQAALAESGAKLTAAAAAWDQGDQQATHQAWKEVVASERYLRRILARIEAALETEY